MGTPRKRVCEDGLHKLGPSETLSEDNFLTVDDNNLGQNPMLNPVVLKHFFGVCKLEDLRRFRLVCPLWRDVSLERWREEMIVHIAFDEYFEHRKNSNKRQRLHWKKAKRLYQTPSIAAKPFRKYRLCSWQFPEAKPDQDRLFKRERRDILNEFWINCGPWMKELHLKQTKIESTGTFREVMGGFVPNLMLLYLGEMSEISLAEMEDLSQVKTQLALRSLGIQFRKFDDLGVATTEEPQMSSDTWFELFVTFPNLLELQWKRFYDVHCENLLLAWSRLVEDERHFGRKLKIKCYNINGYREFEVTQTDTLGAFFQHPDFTFSHVEIDMKNSAQELILSRAIRNHQNKLKSLNLCTETCNLNNLFREPLFLSAARLQLDATPNFHFLKYLPKLEKLTIFGFRNSMADATRSAEMEAVQLQSLFQLKFPFTWDPSGIIYNYTLALDIFVKCMPNLTVLKCPLSNEIFRVVCQHWRGLKTITDEGDPQGVLNDEGITGIIPGEEGRLPNITLLKYLKEFETEHSLSDKSIYDGFLQLEHLTELNIFQDNMSREAYLALRTKFGSQIFHSYKRKEGTYYSYYDGSIEDDDEVVTGRLKVEMFSKDYGIVLGDKMDLIYL